MFRMAADDMATALSWQTAISALPPNAFVQLLRIILEEVFVSFFRDMYCWQERIMLKDMRRFRSFKHDLITLPSPEDNPLPRVALAFSAADLPKTFVDLRHLPNAVQLVKVQYSAIVPPHAETDEHVSEVARELDAGVPAHERADP